MKDYIYMNFFNKKKKIVSVGHYHSCILKCHLTERIDVFIKDEMDLAFSVELPKDVVPKE